MDDSIQPSSEQPLPRSGSRAFPMTLLGLVLATATGVLWSGSDRTPADATAPLEIHGADRINADPDSELIVTSWNIHHGEGQDGVLDLNRIAEGVSGSHFSGLYEVNGGWSTNQAFQLADLTDQAAVFAPTERRWWHNHFGNACLFSREPQAIVRIPLPGTQGKKFRNVVMATVPCAGGNVRILAVHLDRIRDRERQLEMVLELFASVKPPAILMGDLNTERSDPNLLSTLNQPEIVDAVEAIGTDSPDGRIDWMLVKGLEVIDASLVDSEASDHPLIRARFRLNAHSP